MIRLNQHTYSIDQLREGRFKKQLSDLYALQTVVENNAWHKQQSVFDHSLLSVEKFIEILSSDDLLPGVRTDMSKYLAVKIGGLPKIELCTIAVLLHDIGKITTLDVHDDGTTWCPGHADAGATLIRGYGANLGLTDEQLEYVARIVQCHMIPFEQLGKVLANGEAHRHLELVKRAMPNGYPELLVLAYADMSGCVLPEETRANYDARVAIIKDALLQNFESQ